MSAPGYCAVCGRTFLLGEAVRPYVSPEGRHEVCELCAGRADERGWLPADREGAEEHFRAEGARRPSLLTKLFARAERDPDEDLDKAEPPPARRSPASHELDTERYDVEAEWAEEDQEAEEAEPSSGALRSKLTRGAERSEPASQAERPNALRRLAELLSPSPKSSGPTGEAPSEPAPTPTPPPGIEREPVGPRTNLPAVRERGGPPVPAPANPSEGRPPRDQQPRDLPDPAGRGMRPRRLQPDLSPTTRFERAIVRFNAGEVGRTVAGLTRTLGAPSVSVGDLAGEGDIVRVTVAWELTWYQWGVDLDDELRPVYELAKGFEIGEIDSPARQWNASAHDGRIVMVAPARRAAKDGRPVHR